MVDEAHDAQARSVSRRDRRRIIAEPTQQERRRRRLALIIIGALILTIVGIVVAGYVLIFVLPPQQVIVRVGDVSYTRGDMVKLLTLRQKTLELTQAQGLRNSDDIFQALQLIVENEIISQAAPRQGISVSEDEVDNRIRTTMAPSQSESLGKSDAQIEREFNERYRQFLNTTQVSREDHRGLVRRAILREKFRQYIGDRVPAYGEQVYLHRIGMGQQDQVDIMLTKLADTIGDNNSTENLQAAVRLAAEEFSSDPQTAQSGGDLGWVPLGIHEDYERVFWELEIGEVSDPIPNVDNPEIFYFFMVSDRDGNREIDRRSRDQLKTRALQMWVNEERQNHDVHAAFNSDIYAWFVEQLRLTIVITPTPAPNTNPLQNILGGR